MNPKKKFVLVTWHYTTHGIAYLKHILSAFYDTFSAGEEPNFASFPKEIRQEEMNAVFDSPKERGFKFDKILYLTSPQESFDALSTRHRGKIIERAPSNLQMVYKELEKTPGIFLRDIDKEIERVEKEFPDKATEFKNEIWRTVHHYPISEQIKWLQESSNFTAAYSKNDLQEKNLNVRDLRDEEEITKKVNDFAHKNMRDENTTYIVNVSLGSNETQVAWHILALTGMLPDTTIFIKTYDLKKEEPDKDFKPFTIRQIDTHIIQDISEKISIIPRTKSPKRQLANQLMKQYLASGFAILLMGERGIGKSRIAKMNTEDFQKDKKFISVNCAAFSDDTMAESEFFGYKKGAFTGATTDKEGLIKMAEDGVLFMDEVHHLTKRVQAKLMTAFQTDKDNKMTIRPLGGAQPVHVKNVHLVFATNRTIEELRECLLPDFYDRIVQYVVELPPLRETREDIEEDFKTIWKELKFENGEKKDGTHKTYYPCPDEKKFIDWLKKQPLYGNYRDLQKIALYNKAFLDFGPEIKKALGINNALEYVKSMFQKYTNTFSKNAVLETPINRNSPKTMLVEFKYRLQEWAVKEYGSRDEAAKALEVDVKTLNNWKNGTKA